MTDRTKYSVVRDKVGDLWVNVADDLWSGYGDFPGDELEIRFGPLTPVLDADGLPVVTPAELAAAWDEGHQAGHEDARAVQSTYPEPTPNPYRAEGDHR